MIKKNLTNSVKAIIFDFGDVLCYWDNSIMGADRARSHGLQDESIQKLFFGYLREGGEGKYHSMLDFHDRAKPETHMTREIAHKLFNEWENSAQVDQEMINLLKQLKHKYKIGLLSNFPKGLEEYLVGRFHIHHLFDSVVSSYNIQMRKPRLDVYRYSAEDLHFQPQECLFVDDIEKNVRAAEKVGMHGILFIGAEDLKKKFGEILGIQI